MNEDRLKHSYSVGKKMMELGKGKNLCKEEIEDLFVLGLNHDIGYEVDSTGRNHNKIGGKILKRNGYKYWKEVYYHGEKQDEYNSLYLKILNSADMQIDKFGNDVGFEKRLEDIKSRYGEKSEVYHKCVELIDSIK
ncbi:MAG: HD domain-containing protein [Bacilli bacterium]|nr:HD domain-containing protein [Bacilli bacterium]